ncbi:hypothetical protein QR680_012240 [Steinernema hermaphroditum]|uniref:Rho-GAP domain-containing protein n=1 Tax=Steinernema hermaphroditum TaxID=289476 RepID=A0AA39I1D6_9BILA|nr:hypothetical protein QR680_012240 [Steinernema hermaphroditum]
MNDGGVIPRFDGDYFFASVQRRPSQNRRVAAPFRRPLRRSDSDPIAPPTPYDNNRDVIDDCIAEMLDIANELANIGGVVQRRPQYLSLHQQQKQQQQLQNSTVVSTPSSSITATTPIGTATINDSLLSDNSSFFGDAEMSSASSEASFGSSGRRVLNPWKRGGTDGLRSSEEGSAGAESPYSRYSSKRLIVNDDGYYTHISASGMSAMSSLSPPVEYDYPPGPLILDEYEKPQYAAAGDLTPPPVPKMRTRTDRKLDAKNIKKRISTLFLTNSHLDNNNVYDLETLPALYIDGLRQSGLRKLQAMYSANGSDEPVDAQNRKNAVMKNVQKFLKHVRKQAGSSSSSTLIVQKKTLQHVTEVQYIFGTSLCAIQMATCGHQAFPTSIMEVINFLEQTGSECEGVFRRNGTDAGKRALLQKCENAAINASVFMGENELTLAQTHDACALLKQYLRELPDRIINDNVCDHLFRIPNDVSGDQLLETVKYCIWLLPEEHWDALRILLKMLHSITKKSEVNFMNAKNLAVCMTPSLFVLSANRITTNSSSKRRRTVGGSGLPSCRELAEYDIAQKVLTLMIEKNDELFCVSSQLAPSPLKGLPDLNVGYDGEKFHIGRDALAMMEESVRPVLKDMEKNWKDWSNEKEWCDVELSWKDFDDRVRVWKGSIYIDAPTKCVYKKFSMERATFEPNLSSWKTVYMRERNAELVHAIYGSPQTGCERHGLILRFSRACSYSKYPGVFLISERSARADDYTERVAPAYRTPWMNLFQSVFIIVPEGAGTRIHHIYELDMKGKSSGWYESRFAPQIIRRLHMIRDAFQASLLQSIWPSGRLQSFYLTSSEHSKPSVNIPSPVTATKPPEAAVASCSKTLRPSRRCIDNMLDQMPDVPQPFEYDRPPGIVGFPQQSSYIHPKDRAYMATHPKTGLLYKCHKGMAVSWDRVKEKRDGKIFFTYENFGKFNPEQVVKIVEFFQKDPRKNIRYFDKTMRTLLLEAYANDTNSMTYEKRKKDWDMSQMNEEYTSREQIPRGKKVQLYPPLPLMKAMAKMPMRLYPKAIFYDLAKSEGARFCCMTEVWNNVETPCKRLAIYGARVSKELIFMAKDKNFPVYQKSRACHAYACKYHYRLLLLGAPRDPGTEWRRYEEYEDENILNTVFNHQEFDVDCLITMIASYDLRLCNNEINYFDRMCHLTRNSDQKTQKLWRFLRTEFMSRTYKRLNLLGDMTVSEWLSHYAEKNDHRYDEIVPPDQKLRKDWAILILGGTGPEKESKAEEGKETNDADAPIPAEDLEVLKEFYPELVNKVAPAPKKPPTATTFSQDTLLSACIASQERRKNPDPDHYYPPVNAEQHVHPNRRRFEFNAFKVSLANHILEAVLSMTAEDRESVRKIVATKPGKPIAVTHLIHPVLKSKYMYLMGVDTDDPECDDMFRVFASSNYGCVTMVVIFLMRGESKFRQVQANYPWSHLRVRLEDDETASVGERPEVRTPLDPVEDEEAQMTESLDSLTLEEAKLFYDEGHERSGSPQPIGDVAPPQPFDTAQPLLGQEEEATVPPAVEGQCARFLAHQEEEEGPKAVNSECEAITLESPEEDDDIEYLGEQPYQIPEASPPRPAAPATVDSQIDADAEVDVLGSDEESLNEYDCHIMEERRREEAEKEHREFLEKMIEEGQKNEPAKPPQKETLSKEEKEKRRAEWEFDTLQEAILNDRKRRFEEIMEQKEREERAIEARDAVLFTKNELGLLQRFEYRLKSLSSAKSLEDLRKRNEVLEGIYGMPMTERPELNTVKIDYDNFTPKNVKKIRKHYNLPHCSKRAPMEEQLKDVPQTLNEEDIDAVSTLAAMFAKRQKENKPEPPAHTGPPPLKIRIITPKPPPEYVPPPPPAPSTSTPRSRKAPTKKHKKRRALRNPFCY